MLLDEVKQYLRIDGTYDDAFIKILIGASRIYIKNETGKEIAAETTDDLQKLAIFILCAHWYEHRGTIGQINENDKLHYSLQNICLQIAYCN